jgi:hypothetical protein
VRKETERVRKEAERVRKETERVRKEAERVRKETERVRKETEGVRRRVLFAEIIELWGCGTNEKWIVYTQVWLCVPPPSPHHPQAYG